MIGLLRCRPKELLAVMACQSTQNISTGLSLDEGCLTNGVCSLAPMIPFAVIKMARRTPDTKIARRASHQVSPSADVYELTAVQEVALMSYEREEKKASVIEYGEELSIWGSHIATPTATSSSAPFSPDEAGTDSLSYERPLCPCPLLP
jgi:hypothetical protein